MTLTNLGTINNNTVQTRLNQSVTTSEPNDIFKFSITNNRSVNLLLTGLSSTEDADLALYRDRNGDGRLQTFGSNADQLISTSENGASFDDHINRWRGSGTYFAVVEQYNSTSPISYDLYVSASQQSILTGPPNTLAREQNLGTLSSDRTSSGSVGFRADSGTDGFGLNERGDTSDLYYFTLPSGRTANITLSGLNADADIRLIRDSDNDRILDATPNEVVASSTNTGTTNDTISVSTSGNYYLQVYPYAQTNDINYSIRFDV
jgi:hypothetical protein